MNRMGVSGWMFLLVLAFPGTHTHPFLQAGCPSCCPTNSVKALKAGSSGQRAVKRLCVYVVLFGPEKDQICIVLQLKSFSFSSVCASPCYVRSCLSLLLLLQSSQLLCQVTLILQHRDILSLPHLLSLDVANHSFPHVLCTTHGLILTICAPQWRSTCFNSLKNPNTCITPTTTTPHQSYTAIWFTLRLADCDLQQQQQWCSFLLSNAATYEI